MSQTNFKNYSDDWDAPIVEQQASLPPISTSHRAPSATQLTQRTVAVSPSSNQPSPRTFPLSEKPGQYPATLSRSALFPCATGNTSQHKNRDVAIQGKDCSLHTEGPALTQRDKHVYLSVITSAKNKNADIHSNHQISLSKIAKQLGVKRPDGKSTKSIRSSLNRLAATHISVRLPSGRQAHGKLLAAEGVVDKKAFVAFDPVLVTSLFEYDKQFESNLNRSCSLGNALAQWLHGFFETHSKAIAMDMKYLRQMSGFCADSDRFVTRIASAMSELSSKAPELIASFSIDKSHSDSDFWKLTVVRGTDEAKFTDPDVIARHARADKQKKRALSSRRKGGVQL